MDRSRLQGTAAVEVRFVTAGEIASAAGADLIVVDLARPGHIDALAHRPSGVDVVGFGPHVDADLLARATEAGCGRVLPRSRFFREWPDV
jgi:hypothetical protein